MQTRNANSMAVFSVGHGNRTQSELFEMLRESGIHTLVDVRAIPQSRRHPQFGMEALRAAAEAVGVVYHWAGRQLGGRREPRPDSVHIALTDPGLRGFADYMGTDAFQRAAVQLLGLSARAPTAMLCAERLPESCHRSLIADYLLLQGSRVEHLIQSGESREHALDARARRESSCLIYDRQTSAALDL